MDETAGVVLDASALLAYLRDEPGSHAVEAAWTARAIINAVNYAEVLSRLGDRACLATALRHGRPAITADRAWVTIDVGVTVQLIRP